MNTTSKLQLCDGEIIQNTKMHYLTLLVGHGLFHMDDASTSDLAKKRSILWMLYMAKMSIVRMLYCG